MHKKTWLLIVLLAVVLSIVALGIFAASRYYPIKAGLKGQRVVTDTWARGDFVSGPVTLECTTWMKNAEQEQQLTCELLNAQVGHTEKECPKGYSPEGCSKCTIACK
jgi:hypothetical protein